MQAWVIYPIVTNLSSFFRWAGNCLSADGAGQKIVASKMIWDKRTYGRIIWGKMIKTILARRFLGNPGFVTTRADPSN
jgi:hypothetical protein